MAGVAAVAGWAVNWWWPDHLPRRAGARRASAAEATPTEQPAVTKTPARDAEARASAATPGESTAPPKGAQRSQAAREKPVKPGTEPTARAPVTLTTGEDSRSAAPPAGEAAAAPPAGEAAAARPAGEAPRAPVTRVTVHGSQFAARPAGEAPAGEAPGGEAVVRVMFVEEVGERAEVVELLRRCGNCGLCPDLSLPEFLHGLTVAEAQGWLDAHPLPRRWRSVALTDVAGLDDAVVRRLCALAELERVAVFSHRITDVGIAHLAGLPALRHLVVYSRAVSDACLPAIVGMRALRWLDMQGSPGVSAAGLSAAVAGMPWLERDGVRAPWSSSPDGRAADRGMGWR